MTVQSILRQIKSFEFILVLISVGTVGVVGYFIYHLNPGAHRDYSAALLEFSVADALLTEDLYRLQSGDLANYDSLVRHEQALRSAEHRLSRLPEHVADLPQLDELTTRLSVLMNEKLVRTEDFKSTIATLRATLDNLPALASASIESPRSGRLPRDFIEATLEDLLLYVGNTEARRHEAITRRLTSLKSLLEEDGDTETPTPIRRFFEKATLVANYHQSATAQLRDITGVPNLEGRPTPLNVALAQLSHSYHLEHQRSRIGVVVIMAGVFAAMLMLLLVLSYITRWRSRRADAIIAEKQESLAIALKEAKARSIRLQDDETSEATRLAQERLTALVRNTFEYIAIISREENFIYLSPAIEAILALSESELIGKSVYEGIHADDIIRVKDYLTRAQKELHTSQTITYRVMDAYGKWHVVETYASNQHSNPAIRGMILNTRRLNDTPQS